MGNYISCALIASMKAQSKGSRVIYPNNEIKQLDEPTTAAELMLENPGYFLVSSRSMAVGRRFSPLSADEELEMRDVYVMFPMKKVNAVVAAADMGRLLMAASTAVRRVSGGKIRVLPEVPPAPPEPVEVVRTVEEEGEVCVGEFKYRLSMCRSRRPGLETIAEETICSR